MNYQDYDVEDFVMNVSFQNYCLGKEEQDMLFWEAWVIDNPHKKERVQEAKKLFILLNGNTDAHQFRRDAESFRNKLYEHLGKDKHDTLETTTPTMLPQNHTRGQRWFLYAGSIAASLLLMLMLFYFRDDKPQQPLNEAPLSAQLIYTSLHGERKSFQLPDGSTVLMNGGSSIEVSKDFNIADREISLKGEAYFNVTHNAQKPFIIHTNNINVKVLGTEFDVKAYPEDKTTEAILIRGSVEVTLHDKPEAKIILKPQHKLIVQNKSASIEKTSDSTVVIPKIIPEKIKMLNVTLNASDSTVMETSWKDNRLNFSDETLAEVALKLERWYGVKVNVEGDIAWKYKFTGIFENETIDETLKALQLSLFFHYHIENGKILITK